MATTPTVPPHPRSGIRRGVRVEGLHPAALLREPAADQHGEQRRRPEPAGHHGDLREPAHGGVPYGGWS
jgi:hypothetical protein